jgi:large subunit ribosomal protein L22
MSEARATLSNYRQSPRKVRGVVNLIRGKSVEDAQNILAFVPKRSAGPVQKLLASAVANAKNLSIPMENLFVKEVSVNGGAILYRRLPMSRGRAFVIRKRTSHVDVVLGERAPKAKKEKTTSKAKKAKK